MEDVNIFIDKEEINKLFEEEKYKNCMDKKYFEYIVSNGKIDYIDEYLKNSKNKGVIKSLVSKNKVVTVMDKLSVSSENKRYIGELESLEIYDIEVSEEIVEKYHDQILTTGIYARIKLEENIDKKYPYYIEEIEVLEDTSINLDEYIDYFSKRVKKHMDDEEFKNPFESIENDNISRIDLVLNTIGISTSELTFWEKIIFLVRLIPLCETNYSLMELGGTGIGKTKTYSMFSPECEIVQEMSSAELIYNRQSKTSGLLKTKNVIVFDEVNKLKLEGDKEKIIPQLLNYMADGQTSSPRKVTSKASFVFSGNAMKIQERIEKNEKNIFDNSHKLEDIAFLDRIHFFLPAWGLRRYSKNIHEKNMAKKVFRFDYFSKALNLLRDEDYSKILEKKGYEIGGASSSEREVRAIKKTVSGLIKLTHPDKKIDRITLEAYIAIAIKGRGLINKFLNNKDGNNVSKIDIEVRKTLILFGIRKDEDKELIQVNESLKQLIYRNNSGEIKRHYNKYLKALRSDQNDDIYIKESSKLKLIELFRKTFKSSRFYPNRQIILFDNEKKEGKLVFLKIALDKMGILKNKREAKILKEYYDNKNEVKLLNDGRILEFQSHKQIEDLEYNEKEEVNFLHNKHALNYDGLFGDQSLDKNDFTGKSLDEGTRGVEADLSNVYYIKEDMRLKLENGEYVIPQFIYSEDLDIYYYEYSNSTKLIERKEVSKKMTYVEFKYFLANNGFIDLK